ncbi:hypothetical protein [Parasitella parasitica]|uniref:Kinetochore protein Sos7 coiled-coil domain-containing protein n=1 Tax=Parasitella parasitica TaxID=35722 RepID=A0A0B7NFI8_9FUNG|nr:hypothetical protein [Parasitella parasitica]
MPTKPLNLKEISLEIDRFNKAQLNLYDCQEDYKKKVGLSGHTRNNLPFHPKALETELNDIKVEHFDRLSRNYIEFLAKEKFLQCILQEPPLEITELDDTVAREKTLKKELERYIQQVDDLGKQIAKLALSIEQKRSKTQTIIEEATDTFDQIIQVEEEIARIDNIVAKQSQRTIEEAKSLLVRQTEDITKLNKVMMEKKDSIGDHKWRIEDLEEEVRQLQLDADKIKAEADNAIHMSRMKDERVEVNYNQYIETTNLCNQLFGVDKIEFESNSMIHLYLRNTVLHVEIDLIKNQIHNVKITGTTVPIEDFVKVAQQTSANEGIRIITLETLARLKRL